MRTSLQTLRPYRCRTLFTNNSTPASTGATLNGYSVSGMARQLSKGVVRPDDARRAVDLGFNAVMVSNHGGRQLDRSPAPVHVLESIVDAVGLDAEVILDGGVRRGTDILIALALGARAVGFARPFLYGLAAAGEAGARRAMDILTNELRRDMVLLGTDRISKIKRSLVRFACHTGP